MQFNLGNRIYQIGDYKESGQLEFPTALLTFVNDENAFGRDLSLRYRKIMSNIFPKYAKDYSDFITIEIKKKQKKKQSKKTEEKTF